MQGVRRVLTPSEIFRREEVDHYIEIINDKILKTYSGRDYTKAIEFRNVDEGNIEFHLALHMFQEKGWTIKRTCDQPLRYHLWYDYPK